MNRMGIGMKKSRLDKEDQRILNAIEEGRWELVKPKKAELEHYARAAKNTFKKSQRMNIWLSQVNLNRLKAKAAEEGVPYQTLVASILHKYVSGNLRAA